ncbi:hypothetical protein B0H11DRAFT_2183177 [Mycena galericulata]|nr:hypothetical protein B0H11DRAFT_2183177 [Mycena galericulata]
MHGTALLFFALYSIPAAPLPRILAACSELATLASNADWRLMRAAQTTTMTSCYSCTSASLPRACAGSRTLPAHDRRNPLRGSAFTRVPHANSYSCLPDPTTVSLLHTAAHAHLLWFLDSPVAPFGWRGKEVGTWSGWSAAAREQITLRREIA